MYDVRNLARRLLRGGVVVALFALNATVASAEEPQVALAKPTQFIFGSPGELTVDASNSKVLFPMPTVPREFQDWEDFANFVQQELNGEIIRDASGNASGLSLRFAMLGEPKYYHSESGQVRAILDPIVAYLFGVNGRFVVKGDCYEFIPYSSNPPPSDDDLLASEASMGDDSLQASAAEATAGDPFLISGWSFFSYGTDRFRRCDIPYPISWMDWLDFGGVTKQVYGGYHEAMFWNGSTNAVRNEGENHLAVSSTLYGSNGPPIGAPRAEADNVVSVTSGARLMKFNLPGTWGSYDGVSSWHTGDDRHGTVAPGFHTCAGSLEDAFCPNEKLVQAP
jgi:hypothetical protein